MSRANTRDQNPEIAIYRYAVEGSFDAYSWQTVERKARFIAQVMRGRLGKIGLKAPFDWSHPRRAGDETGLGGANSCRNE